MADPMTVVTPAVDAAARVCPCRNGSPAEIRAWAEIHDPDAPAWLRSMAPGGSGSYWSREVGDCTVPYVARDDVELAWCGERR